MEKLFANQSWKWGKPGRLISPVSLTEDRPVEGDLEEANSPDAEEKIYTFTPRPGAGTYIMLFHGNGWFYSPIEGEAAKVYCWHHWRGSGHGFIFFRPGAKVRLVGKRSSLRVLTPEGAQKWTPPDEVATKVTL
ncbi:MAG: hypothetical protein AB2448_01830 [Moorella sp. (in: firmicutes)]